MSRMFDRLQADGPEPVRLGDVLGVHDYSVAFMHRFIEQFSTATGRSHPEIDRVARLMLAETLIADPQSFQPIGLDDCVVINASNVASYMASLPEPVRLSDFGALCLAPPWTRFFVEYANPPQRSEGSQARTIGVLCEGTQFDDGFGLALQIFVEGRRSGIRGPVCEWQLRLGEHGQELEGRISYPLFADGDAQVVVVPNDHPDVPAGASALAVDDVYKAICGSWLHPVLLAIGFCHAKNVDRIEVQPTDKLTARHRKPTGRPLNRYIVLDIGPMTKVLDSVGGARQAGIGRAVHICRGHFKTYTNEARLFGRIEGSWFWPAHVRGKPARGRVDKDYRVVADPTVHDELGQRWVDVDEHPRLVHSG